jgi:hypothetical protein
VANEHISSEAVRQYLLGILDEQEVARVEERYFTDRKFFLWVKAEEERLIADYLAGRLESDHRQAFEKQCLTLPALAQRLEQARSRQKVLAVLPNTRSVGWTRGLKIAAVILLAIGVATTYGTYSNALQVEPLPAVVRSHTLLTSLSLDPGLSKGDSTPGQPPPLHGSSQAQGYVQLVLRLPGQRTPALYRASIVSPGGKLNTIWSSPAPQWSTAQPGTQALVLDLDSSILPNGDYLVEVQTAEGITVNKYPLRVIQ